jgi:proteasome lid subunit RPN8/RPN11
VRIATDLRRQMQAMGEAAYPNEGCGIFIGRPAAAGADAEVLEVRLGTNLREDRARDRYILDPRDILKAERDAEARGLEVVGFWHTHPDHPAQPSQYDADHAWPDYVYVIMAIHAAKQVDVNAFVLDEAGEPPRFRAESLA